MHKTRLSLFYLAGYLLIGGTGFLVVPQTMLNLFLSNGDYSDVMVRFVGLLLLALGILVVQIIRVRALPIYPATLIVRTVILVGLLIFFVVYRDPMMMVLFGIVGIGFALTLTCLMLDRRSVYDDLDFMDGGL
jgi:uncharacterized protein YjeT (DUF2065 family)